MEDLVSLEDMEASACGAGTEARSNRRREFDLDTSTPACCALRQQAIHLPLLTVTDPVQLAHRLWSNSNCFHVLRSRLHPPRARP
jgi:hypothetical protein